MASKKKATSKKKRKKKVAKKQVANKPVGSPLLYPTPKEMQHVVDLYYLVCKAHQLDKPELLEDLSEDDLLVVNGIEDVTPSISGLAYTLGMSTEAFRNYEQKGGFLATVKRAKQRVEMSLEQRLAGNAVTGSIFSLKNNFGWKDKTEVDNTNKNYDFTGKTDEELQDIIDGKA